MALLALCHTPCHHATRAPSFSHMPHGTARFAQMAHTPMCCPHMATLDFPSFFCTCFLLHPIYVSLEFFSRLQGVQFVFDCCMGLRPYDGEGCILADDMGHIYIHFPHMSHAILPIYQRRFSFFRLQAKLSNRSPSSGLSCARFESRFFRMPQLILARLLVWKGPGAKRPLRRFLRLRLLFNQLSRLRFLEYLSF